MLSLRKIEEGACYLSDETKNYVAWSLLCYSSQMFWHSETILILDKVKELINTEFNNHPDAFTKLMDLCQKVESPLLDTIRIVICFENYFKALMLLQNYIIHQMDLNFCRNKYPQFLSGSSNKRLRQETIPIQIYDVKQAESHDDWTIDSLQTLTNQTIGINKLIDKPNYRIIFSKSKNTDDRLFSILKSLIKSRNSLHFLTIEYIPFGLTGVHDYLFLRDYVRTHIDIFGENFYNKYKGSINTGRMEIESFEADDI